MTVIERDGRKYVDDETLRELLNTWWDDYDIICNGLPVEALTCPVGDDFVAVTHDGRLLSEDDVYDIADARLRETYPGPAKIAHLEFDVEYALAKFAPDAYEEYVNEEVDHLIEHDALRRLRR